MADIALIVGIANCVAGHADNESVDAHVRAVFASPDMEWLRNKLFDWIHELGIETAGDRWAELGPFREWVEDDA